MVETMAVDLVARVVESMVATLAAGMAASTDDQMAASKVFGSVDVTVALLADQSVVLSVDG